MSGPPRTPTHLRLVRGNPSKRPINKKEPKPPSGVPPTPKHFSKQEKYWFRRMAEELNDIGVITRLDGMALELMIGAYIEWRHHRDVIAEVGESYQTTTSTGDIIIRAHPQVAMRDRAFNNICKMMSEFGITPASQAKVSGNTPAEEDPFEAFLKKRK